MRILDRLWRLELATAIIFLAGCSLSRPVKTAHSGELEEGLEELKQIRKSESAQRVLISNDIRCISADENNVWIATDRGVSRYQRATSSWMQYTKEDGLGSDNVNTVASDREWVWFGTDNGVSRYDTDTGTWQTFGEKDGLKGAKVLRIAVDVDYVWVGTNGGINRYDRNIDSWSARTVGDGLSNHIVSAIAVEDEYVWIGTHFRANRYSRATDSWNIYSVSSGLAANFITTIAVTDDYVWFGTYRSGISVYNKTNQAFMKTYTKADVLSSNDVRSIAIDGNNIWIGTASGGVHRHIEAVDAWVRYTKDDGLASNNISWITAFRNEIWLGTYDSGVTMYDKEKNRWITFVKADSPPEDDVKAMARSDSGKLWVATSDGLLQYDPRIDEWTRYGKKDGLSTEYITDLRVDGDTVWIGTSRGLASYHEKYGSWQFYNNSHSLSEDFVTSLEVTDEDGLNRTIWVGTNIALFQGSMDGQSLLGKLEPVVGLSGHRITSIVHEGNEMWIGTDGGLWEYDISVREVSLHATKHGLIDNYINCIMAQGEQVWLGTRSGIGIYERGAGVWHSIGVSEGLPGSNVRALMSDTDRRSIWIGTSGGLAKYDTETGKLGVIEGSAKYIITSIARLSEDILWLGTSSGVVEYHISSGEYREYRAFVTRQPLREPSVTNIEFDGDAIWFSNWSASQNGAIIRYDRQSDTWRRFTRETVLGDTKARSPTIVKRICVDDKWVWFATDYGVLQYDKLADTWQHFTTEDGLLSNNVRCVQSSANAVWVCPEMRTRINKYDKRDGMWSEIKLSRLIHPRNYIYDMQADGDSVWLSISSSGVRKISEDGEQRAYMRDDGLAQMGARCINVDEDYVWVAHWKGRGSAVLSRYEKATGEWTVYSSSDVLEADMISEIVSGETYTWIVYESWVAGKVTGFNRKTGEWITVKPKARWGAQAKEVCEDGGCLWFASVWGEIKRYHMASDMWMPLYRGQVNENALKADDKYLWLGTPRGISRYDKERELWTDYTEENALFGKSVRTVVSDDRYIWCGTSRGISRYDKIHGTWTNFSREKGTYSGMRPLSPIESKWRGAPPSVDITALAVDDRYLWVATPTMWAGRYDKMIDRWDMYNVGNGSCIVVDGYDVWMGTGDTGIGKFPRMSDDRNAWIRYTSGLEIKAGAMTREYANTLVSNKVCSVAADRDYIWVGTIRGVSRYSKEADTWATYTTENGLASNEISSICADDNAVWFGSDKGVTVYNRESGEWIKHNVNGGLASNKITCITRSADAVWLGTFDAGLIRYDKKAVTWRTYSREDGLGCDCVLSVSVDGDCIWIGTRRGLSRYDVIKNNWTTYTQYGDSEDEMEMVMSRGEIRSGDAGKSTPARGDVEIVEINANPPGRDEENLNGEWVRIANTTNAPVDMTGFTLSDQAGHAYKFGELSVPGGSAVTVFRGSGTDTPSSLYWGSKAPVWNNRGDTAYLRDASGELVDRYSY